MRVLKEIVYFVALPIILIVVWWFSTLGSTSIFVPKPGQLVGVFGTVWFSDDFTADVIPSLIRLLGGLVIAVIVGVGLGLLIGSFHWVRAFLEPMLEFLRAVPPPVMVPVLMLIIGIGDSMKVFVIAMGCLWPILLNTVEGVRGVDDVLINTCRSYGMSPSQRMWYLTIRAASPQIAAGVRQALSLGLILMVISEMFAASSGIGYMIVQFQQAFEIPQMWSGIVLLGILGLLLALLFRLIERRALSWYYGIRKVEQ